ncbi:MAG TPA: transcription antitermination factor NusB [Phycisphaerales bacterium]|nr:transcription antitermination factor NusB [Phycisphaerales bacterium]
MSTPREVRRLAFQILYQLDAIGPGHDAAEVLATLAEDDEEAGRYTAAERQKAFTLASEAYTDRAAADAFMNEAAPGWPAHRQAAVDRAILRLAHYEMTSGKTPPKIAVNEAVELAKVFSTEKSPAFVNGLLDKVLKKVLGEEGTADGAIADAGGVPASPETPATPSDSGVS